MFRWYGIFGLLMVLFAEVNFFLEIQPFANWYFPIIWFGFILVVDTVNFRLSGKSLIHNEPKKFLFLILLSAMVWWMFESVNSSITNWSYQGLSGFGAKGDVQLFATISFSTVIPAVFETSTLLGNIHLFDHIKLKRKHKITKHFLHSMVWLGVLFLFLPIILPTYFFPLVWLSFFFFLDPINYLNKKPSIISHLKDKKLKVPLSLALGGLVCGFFWEFWNYWAIPKWTYSVPFVGFLKVFEMPILGYLGYPVFAWELFAMYNFMKTLHSEEKHLLHELGKLEKNEIKELEEFEKKEVEKLKKVEKKEIKKLKWLGRKELKKFKELKRKF